ncbi:MAG: hypothetical protein ACFCU5_02520 [Pleurocapsa sp.]
MKLSPVEQAEQAKHLLLTRLKENQTPMSLQDLETNLSLEQDLSHRTLKEAAWKLVEEGKAQFTSTWDLESI